jgi:hypothetical protein
MRRYRWELRVFSACQKDAPRLNFAMQSELGRLRRRFVYGHLGTFNY